MKKALVTGVGRYLPERKITTEEMEEMINSVCATDYAKC